MQTEWTDGSQGNSGKIQVLEFGSVHTQFFNAWGTLQEKDNFDLIFINSNK